MPDKTELMRHIALFRGLADAQLQTLVDAARLCVYPRDAVIVEQGQRIEEAQDGDSLYLIAEGRVRVVRDRDEKQQLLAELGPGEFFGEMTLLDGKPRSATVIADDDTQCLILSRWDLLRAMRRDPDIAINMLAVMSARLRSMQNLLV